MFVWWLVQHVKVQDKVFMLVSQIKRILCVLCSRMCVAFSQRECLHMIKCFCYCLTQIWFQMKRSDWLYGNKMSIYQNGELMVLQ